MFFQYIYISRSQAMKKVAPCPEIRLRSTRKSDYCRPPTANLGDTHKIRWVEKSNYRYSDFLPKVFSGYINDPEI